MWLVYGVAIQSAPVVLGNAVTLVLNALLLVMRLSYGRQR
jgi:MtN3 and saliva related transmembrane protein